MPARKKRLVLSDTWKDKIRAGVIMQRLLGHVNGKVDMTSTQVKAADILLKKIVPDVARTEHVGEDGGPVKTENRWLVEFVRPSAKPDAS